MREEEEEEETTFGSETQDNVVEPLEKDVSRVLTFLQSRNKKKTL